MDTTLIKSLIHRNNMEEKIKILRRIVGELAETIWSLPQSQWFDWANTHLVFIQSETDGDMVRNIFTSNEGQGFEDFRMIVWVDPCNQSYQEAVIRGLQSQTEVDLF